jgi:hypothetical protein
MDGCIFYCLGVRKGRDNEWGWFLHGVHLEDPDIACWFYEPPSDLERLLSSTERIDILCLFRKLLSFLIGLRGKNCATDNQDISLYRASPQIIELISSAEGCNAKWGKLTRINSLNRWRTGASLSYRDKRLPSAMYWKNNVHETLSRVVHLMTVTIPAFGFRYSLQWNWAFMAQLLTSKCPEYEQVNRVEHADANRTMVCIKRGKAHSDEGQSCR